MFNTSNSWGTAKVASAEMSRQFTMTAGNIAAVRWTVIGNTHGQARIMGRCPQAFRPTDDRASSRFRHPAGQNISTRAQYRTDNRPAVDIGIWHLSVSVYQHTDRANCRNHCFSQDVGHIPPPLPTTTLKTLKTCQQGMQSRCWFVTPTLGFVWYNDCVLKDDLK